jgi:CRP-like cAMP-binding protein
MLDIQQLKAIFKDVPVKMLKESEVLIQEHTYFKFIPIVLKGSLKISRVDDRGNDMFLYYIKEGESCIMSFLGGMHHQQSSLRASAEEDTELMFIPIEKSIDLIRTTRCGRSIFLSSTTSVLKNCLG